jgi:hypothetical protein
MIGQWTAVLHQELRYCLVPTPCTVRGIACVGSGLIAIRLLALSFPLTLVVPLVVLLDFVGSAGQGVRTRDPG